MTQLMEQLDACTRLSINQGYPENMCTKPCSGLNISCGTKWMTGLRFYPTSDIEHYQLMRLHQFVVN